MLRSALSVVCVIVAALITCSAHVVAHAQAQPSSPPVVVFFAPESMAPSLRAVLEDALATQLSLLQATLHYETPTRAALEPVERLQVAKQTASDLKAVAVFWLELPSHSPWLLYAVDASAEHVIMRPLAAHDQSPEADIEALALIVRATTDALLHGEPLPSTPDARVVEAPPTVPAPVQVSEPPRDAPPPGAAGLQVTGAYVGTTFAKQRPWLNAFALRAAWLWPQGPYVGVGFTFFPGLTFQRYPARFEIDRYPFSVHGGMRLPVWRFTFVGELGLELELRDRRTITATDVYLPTTEQLKALLNVCPKVEARFAVAPWLMVFAGVGFDMVLGNYGYTVRAADTRQRQYLLEPSWIRLALHAGLGIMR